jgi:hypothetical protein
MHDTNTICCIYSKLHPDDEKLIYSKYVDDYWNKLREREKTLIFWSLLRKYITMHGPYHDARSISRCTVHIIMHGPYHDARSISWCTVHIIMHGPYHDARSISWCTVHIMMHVPYHDARSISWCTVHIMMHVPYHDARSTECQIIAIFQMSSLGLDV